MSWEILVVEHLRHKKREKLDELRERLRDRLNKHRTDRTVATAEEVEEGIDEKLLDDYRKATKDLIADALSSVYWESLQHHLLGKQVTQKMIGKRLGISESNLSRWANRKTLPDPNKIFLAISAWELDARQIRFYQSPEKLLIDPAILPRVMRIGLCRAMEQIHTRELECKYERLDEVALVYLHMLYEQRQSDLFGHVNRTNDADREQIREDVLKQLKKAHPEAKSLSRETVRRVEAVWFTTYVLLACGLPHEWQFLFKV